MRSIILLGAFLLTFCAAANGLPENFHLVDETNRIYRSGQPDREEFRMLESIGFKTVLNLRNYHSDRKLLRGSSITEFRVPGNAGSMTEEHIMKALRVVRYQPKPILIHCWHGSDRTGTVVAAVRIVFNGWEVERAIAEMMEDQYGHHKRIYSNLPELLRSIDWDKVKQELKSETSLRIFHASCPFPVLCFFCTI